MIPNLLLFRQQHCADKKLQSLVLSLPLHFNFDVASDIMQHWVILLITHTL